MKLPSHMEPIIPYNTSLPLGTRKFKPILISIATAMQSSSHPDTKEEVSLSPDSDQKDFCCGALKDRLGQNCHSS